MLALKLMVRTSALQELKPMVLLVANSPRRVPMTFLQILTQLTFLQNLSLLSSPRRDPEAALPTAKSTPTSQPSLMLALKLMARMSALQELKPMVLLVVNSPRRDPEAALPTAKSTPTSQPSGMLALKLMVRTSALLQLKPMLLRPSPRRDLEAAPALPTAKSTLT